MCRCCQVESRGLKKNSIKHPTREKIFRDEGGQKLQRKEGSGGEVQNMGGLFVTRIIIGRGGIMTGGSVVVKNEGPAS